MGTTRPGDPDSSLPQTLPVDRGVSLHFVVNPLVSHIRRNQQSAMEFVVEQFKRHRVTSIGEQHGPSFSTDIPAGQRRENGCVRMFIRDLCNALNADPDARFRYFVIELDEGPVVQRFGEWRTLTLPSGFVNRKAYWLAEVVRVAPALREVFLAIARIPEDRVEVVGIDHRVGELSYERAGEYTRALDGGDLTPEAGESTEQFQRRREQVIEGRQQDYERRSLERETVAATKFEMWVLRNLGDDRALIYYGANHLREGTADPGRHYYSGFTNLSFVRQLIQRDNGLSADDIYSIYSIFPGTERVSRSVTTRQPHQGIAHEVELLRVFDMLRAEFPAAHNIGFDVDDAHYALRPVDQRARYPLGERFDGCIYFRDLNRWDGQTDPPIESRAQPAAVPDLSITSAIPRRAAPGNVIFIYGFVLTANTRVTVVTQTAGGQVSEIECSEVTCLNENLIRARVPTPGPDPSTVGGREATIRLTRPGAPTGDEPVELQWAFRYVVF